MRNADSENELHLQIKLHSKHKDSKRPDGELEVSIRDSYKDEEEDEEGEDGEEAAKTGTG